MHENIEQHIDAIIDGNKVPLEKAHGRVKTPLPIIHFIVFINVVPNVADDSHSSVLLKRDKRLFNVNLISTSCDKSRSRIGVISYLRN